MDHYIALAVIAGTIIVVLIADAVLTRRDARPRGQDSDSVTERRKLQTRLYVRISAPPPPSLPAPGTRAGCNPAMPASDRASRQRAQSCRG
jgi:hypothetical protein